MESWFFSNKTNSIHYYGECMLDPGIFYKAPDGLHPINKFATRLMFERYTAYLRLQPLSTYHDDQLPYQLERYVLRSLLNRGKLEFTSIFADDDNNNNNDDDNGKRGKKGKKNKRRRDAAVSQEVYVLPGDISLQNFIGTNEFRAAIHRSEVRG